MGSTLILASQELHWNAENTGSHLAKQVLIDALLMAKCHVLVHGVSNVITAVSFINPNLKLVYLYKDNNGQTQICDQPRAVNAVDAIFDRSKHAKRHSLLIEAERCLREVLRLKPTHWGAANNLGTLLQQRGDVTEAAKWYDQALQLNPNFAEAIANRASLWQLKGELERAKPDLIRALQLKPDYLPAHLNLAYLHQQQGRLNAAMDHFRRVIEIDPRQTAARFQLGQILEYQDQLEAALEHYQQALELDPTADYIHTFIDLIHLSQCNWQDYERRTRSLVKALIHDGLAPLIASRVDISLPLHRSIAQAQAQRVIASNQAKGLSQRSPQKRDRQNDLLRVGYLSPDLRDHAVGRLLYQVFCCHDRQKFRVYAYATVDTYDLITEQVQQGCDQFANLGLMTTQQAAQRIQENEIDILIDLAGYTIGNGATILALQPAPIQAQFLGYPDTMGAPFIQYAIADDWLITPEIAESYTEEIIRLPHAFVGSPLAIAEGNWTKADFGLPEAGFVFCCFNNHRKINPEVFAAWMQILDAVADSVLWLSGGTVATESNLRQEAASLGVSGDRLIFSQKVSYAEYLAKYQFADLFLDTFVYSAGSTAIAAIWGGTPVVTRLGKTNASRMGASICAAARLEELICPTTAAYVEKAIALAMQPERLAAIREQLMQDRSQIPLFDVAGFTRSLEAAFLQMAQQSA